MTCVGTCFRFYTQMRVQKKTKLLPIKLKTVYTTVLFNSQTRNTVAYNKNWKGSMNMSSKIFFIKKPQKTEEALSPCFKSLSIYCHFDRLHGFISIDAIGPHIFRIFCCWARVQAIQVYPHTIWIPPCTIVWLGTIIAGGIIVYIFGTESTTIDVVFQEGSDWTIIGHGAYT